MDKPSPNLKDPSKFRLKPVRRNDPYWGIKVLAKHLNRVYRGGVDTFSDPKNQAWRRAGMIIRKTSGDLKYSSRVKLREKEASRSLELAAWHFSNWFVPRTRVGLYVAIESRPKTKRKRPHFNLEPRISYPSEEQDPDSFVGALLWEHFFSKDNYQRIKHCATCATWFVDQSKNKRGRYCTNPSCANKWWNRAKRYASPNFGKRKRRR